MCRVEFSMEAGTVRKSAGRHSGMVLYSSVLLSVKARCKTGLPFPQKRWAIAVAAPSGALLPGGSDMRTHRG